VLSSVGTIGAVGYFCYTNLIMSEPELPSLSELRHSLAHLLAAAVAELYPDAKRAIGPAIDNGFYYDFEFVKPISDAELPKIEKKMRQIQLSWTRFDRHEVTKEQALKEFAGNQYKKELIEEFAKEGDTLTVYQSGSFRDLCRGGHADNLAAYDPAAFKLTHIAGAYWRGSEKNAMLTRIYGLAFASKNELDHHLSMLEEAKKRDHKKLGLQLGLFFFHETAPGMPYWLPKGVALYNELVQFWREEHSSRGYQEIVSPLLNKKDLYITSGHWDHYLDNMFVVQDEENQTYALKAMNCPNAMVVFGLRPRSYRELPLRLSDTDMLHRNELSGALNGLFRVREFRQDDAHVFVTEDQITDEGKQILEIAERFYSVFNMQYSFRLGTRPQKFMGDKQTWDKAEAALNDILKHSGKEFVVLEGDGAFYGPKIDIVMKDSLGREWQMGTIQLDFQIPANFGLTYVDEHGKEQVPVTIHRAIYGSLERFIGVMIEHCAGIFPLWIAPVQVVVLPISQKHTKYASSVLKELVQSGIRSELDERNETLGKRIRESELQKVPYIIVVGDKEQIDKTVSVRHITTKDQQTLTLSALTTKLITEIRNKS